MSAESYAASARSISERARASSPAPYLDSLNPEQRRAVEALDGPVLVLAGAGVGKTRVLTTRIAHILGRRLARGQEILAVTFTNRAAREMRERIEALTGAPDGLPWMGTFHSIGAKILRRHAELVGLKPNFTILDTDDQLRLLKQLLKAENIDEKRWPARALAGLIDDWKNRGLTPADIGARDAAGFAGGLAGKLYKDYQGRLKTLNAVDFGDLLLESLRLWRENADVLAIYQQRFRYILVDEYQDTNAVQYLWLRLIAQQSRNLCCVGDDDQSIYGWRGAEVENILGFERDFPDATVIRLERNYRSTGHILALASGLIAHNRKRLGKTLFTAAELGAKPTVRGVHDSPQEAREIGDEIEAEQRRGASLADMAILLRTTAQMRAFEDRFNEVGIAYRIVGGPRFYERAEIRDALAYLRLVAQADDDLAFERIYNTPRRGLGEATLGQLHAVARPAALSLSQTALSLIETDELKPRPRQVLRALLADFQRWRGLAAAPEEVARVVIEESGLIAMWKAEKSQEADGRLDNLKELVRALGEFPTLEAFLEHVALVTEVRSEDSGPRVTLMTLHAAKGLEFDVVFLPGWEEGLFPNQRALDDKDEPVGLEGLLDKVIGADLDGGDGGFDVAVAGDHHHRHARMLLLQPFEQLQAVELGTLHPDVEQHQMRPARRDGGDRLVGVARHARLMALVLQDSGDQLADVVFVIDDENVSGHFVNSWLEERVAWRARAGTSPPAPRARRRVFRGRRAIRGRPGGLQRFSARSAGRGRCPRRASSHRVRSACADPASGSPCHCR